MEVRFIDVRTTARWILPRSWYSGLKKVWHRLYGFLYGHNLKRLAQFFGTDKATTHDYVTHYEKLFAPIRTRRLRLLEIGIGGYADPTSGGTSLRMWKAYFARSEIFGLDVHDKRPARERRIHTIQGDQSDPQFLRYLASALGELDLIIDDGSHHNADVISSFQALFPTLKPGGFYAIEDVQTSYWLEFGGNPENHDDRSTTSGYFRALADMINYPEFRDRKLEIGDLVKSVSAVHFYHNLIVVQKRSIPSRS